MAQSAEKLMLMTVDEFLDWDGGGHEGKLELVDGVVRAMAPASYTHNLIQANLAGIIHAHLKARKSPCRVGTETAVVPPMRSQINARVPDLSVSCLPVGDGKRSPDPVLIIEVMSPGNPENTWESIRACANIASVQEILVVESERTEALLFRRGDKGEWPIDGVKHQLSECVTLTSIELSIQLTDIYAGTPLG